MSTGNRPKFNTDSRLTPNGRGPAGERPGSAPERNAAGSPRALRAGVRRFFAPGTPTSAAAETGRSGGLPAAAGVLAALLDRPVAAAPPAVGVETEASSQPETFAASRGVEPAAQPVRLSPRRVGRRVDVPADVARANPSTPPPAGTAATWR